MKTKNIFRMLLVAAALLMGANNVKADTETPLWDGEGSTLSCVKINGTAFTNLTGTSYKLRVYTNNGDQIFIAAGSDENDESQNEPLFYTQYNTWIRNGEYYNSAGYFEFPLTGEMITKLSQKGLIVKYYNSTFSKISLIEVSGGGGSSTTGVTVWTGSVWVGKWGDGGSYGYLPNNTFSSLKCDGTDIIRVYGTLGNLGTDDWGNAWYIQILGANWEPQGGWDCLNRSGNNTSDFTGHVDFVVSSEVASILKNNTNSRDGNCAILNGHNITYTSIVVNPSNASSKTTPTLTFPQQSYSTTYGSTFTAPTATCNIDGLTISYESSNTNVAEVASDGAVTIKGVGQATITASTPATDDYNEATASYELTVNAAPETPQYILVNMGNYECRTYVTTTYIDFSQSVGIKGYYATGLNSEGTAVQFTKVTGVVPSGVPLLLQKISGAFEYKLRISDTENATAPSPNKLKAGSSSSFSWIWGSNIYVLTVHNNLLVFAEVNDRDKQARVDAEHAYLDLNNSNAHARLTISFDDNNNGATGIDAIENNEQSREVIYDLHGQRVQNPTKGVYIINGKKMVVK